MRPYVDRSLCKGNAVCTSVAPTVFDLDDEEIAIVVDPAPPRGLHDTVRDAVSMCPVQALGIRDDQ